MDQRRFRSAVLALGFVTALAARAGAEFSDEAANHRAPVLMRIAFRDGSTRAVLVIAQTPFNKSGPVPDCYFQTPTGQIRLWLDNIVSITDIADMSDRPGQGQSSATIAIDNGQPRRLTFGAFQEQILVQNRDGTREMIDLRKITSLTAIRKTVATDPKAAPADGRVASNRS